MKVNDVPSVALRVEYSERDNKHRIKDHFHDKLLLEDPSLVPREAVALSMGIP